MAQIEMVRAYLEKLLEEGFGERIRPDRDGDYPLPGMGDFYARVAAEGPQQSPRVQVFAVAVRELDSTADLLAELNRINTQIAYARIFWVQKQVLIESDIVADGIDRPSLTTSVNTVGGLAANVGPVLSQRFGGVSPFAEVAADEVPDRGPAGYL